MAVGQYRKNLNVSYIEDTFNNIEIDSEMNPDYPDNSFLEQVFLFTSDNEEDKKPQAGDNYIFSFEVSATEMTSFTIVDDKNYSLCSNKVFTLEEYETKTFTIFFSPLRETDYIMLKIKRRYFEDTSYLYISNFKFVRLLDLLNDTVGGQRIIPINDIYKIGIISDPYTKFYLNNEEILIGKTGIYDFSFEGISIKSLSVFSRQENQEIDYLDAPANYFIIDYQYDDE